MDARRALFTIFASAMLFPFFAASQGCRLIPTRDIQDGGVGVGDANIRGPVKRPQNRSARPAGKSPNTLRAGGDVRSKGPGLNRPLRPPLPGANLGNLFFLLPSPFSGNSRGAASSEMLDLFSAPLMDRRSIIAAAGKLERRSRGILAERRSRACAFFRSAPKPKQRALLGYWRATARSQLNAWGVSASRLDAGVDLHLKSARKSGSLLGDPSRSLKLVRRLRLERQQLIVRWWEGLFRELNSPQNPCPALGPGGKKGESPGAVGVPTKTGPEERLFEPLALARYEFLRRLPAEFRQRLILTFHSPRNSDK